MNINELESKKALLTRELSDVLKKKDEIQASLTQVIHELEAHNSGDPEEQIWNKRKEYNDYDTQEFIVERISNELQLGDIVCAPSSASFKWSHFEQSKFIESIILGLPIPPILMADSKEHLFVIDGMQRVLTMNAFITNQLKLSGLKVLDTLNGLSFKDLIPSRQRKFLNTSIRTITFSNTSEDVKKDLANRLGLS